MAAKRGAFPLRSDGRCAGGVWVCTPEGAGRRGHRFQDTREQRRGAHARRLPPPPGLSTSPATEAGGAHVGCRALARRLHPGRIPSRSRSPGMWGCDCYSTFRRRVSALLLGLRLALSPAWPRGMPPGRSADVTAMLCTSPPPPPLHFLCLWSPLVARERRMRGSMPRFLPVGPSSAPPGGGAEARGRAATVGAEGGGSAPPPLRRSGPRLRGGTSGDLPEERGAAGRDGAP